jgi:hypothetical protein
MEPQVLPAQAGWQWIITGFRLFRPYAALWLLLLFIYWMALLVLSSIPLVGAAVMPMLMPALTAGLMVASRAAGRREAPTLRHIFEPLASNRKAQLTLGAVNLAGSLLALAAPALIDGGAFYKGIPQTADRAQMVKDFPAYARGFAAVLAAFTPTMLALWFAPALVHWRGMSPGKALFFSFFACLRNWRPFLVYGLGWLFFISFVPAMLVLLLAALFTADMRGVTIVSFVVMPYLFVVMGAIACSFYATYLGVFPETAAPPSGPAPVDAAPPAG